MKVIKIIGLVDGTPTRWDGQFIVEAGADGDQGHPRLGTHRIKLITTADRSEATRYTAEAAHALWTQQSRTLPRRPWDGKPNRPLTAFNVGIEEA